MYANITVFVNTVYFYSQFDDEKNTFGYEL